MITHSFTLRALARELDPLLNSVCIREIFTQQKDELIIALDRIPAASRADASPALVVSVAPRFNYLMLRDDIARAKRNSLDLFPHAHGATIERVAVVPSDRIMQIVLAGSTIIVVRLFNTAASNILLVDSSNVVLDAFKNGKELKGTILEPAPPRGDDAALDDRGAFRRGLNEADARSTEIAVRRILPRFGSTYVRETLFRASVDASLDPKAADTGAVERLHDAVVSIVGEAEKPQPLLYHRDEHTVVFSILPLHHLGDAPRDSFATVNEGIRAAVFQRFREGRIGDERGKMAENIRELLARERRSLAKATERRDNAGRAEEYERLGTTLLANLQHIRKGMAEATIPAEGEQVRIVLDPKLTPVQNAGRYFDKAKKLKASTGELSVRVEELREKISQLERLGSELDSCSSIEEFRTFVAANKEVLRALHLIASVAGREEPPFRTFTVAGGFEVWVGKSSANNDLLTMKYARPHDLWFHVRGAGGSHTVLRVAGGSARAVPKEAIRQAAGIAAYYSKMRKASAVPVVYCERKYLRKPKGAVEGAVVLDREEVMFVRPHLP